MVLSLEGGLTIAAALLCTAIAALARQFTAAP